jgi:hypothetical protein
MAWAIAFIVLVLFVGLRHKVGMDWNNYLLMISRVVDVPLTDAFAVAEPGYAMLLWLSGAAGAGVYGANLVGAVIFLFGVFRFASRCPSPWVALAAAFPFLIVVVGMSANRQAIAIGLLLWLVAGWQEFTLRKRVAITLMAALFHFSAIFFLIFSALDLKLRPGYKLVVGLVMLTLMLAFLQMSGGAQYYDQLYVTGQSEITYSPGALMHVLLNGLPALLVVAGGIFRKQLFPNSLMVQMAWVAMSLIPLALVFSAASGRMTLYLFPVSMYAFSALPAMMSSGVQRAAIRTLLAGVMSFMLWYWLAFANSSLAHIPYNNVFWMDATELHL